MIVRPPAPQLRPFVKLLWVTTPTTDGVAPAARERVLPTGAMHLAIRLSGPPLRTFESDDDARGRTVGHAVVGGARAAPHVRDVSEPTHSVGAMLHPGASDVLFGAPADALAGRHTRLDDLWGRFADEVRERLVEAAVPERQLAFFENLLIARAPRVRGVHPAVAASLAHFAVGRSVRDMVRDTGYSHRHFLALFRREVGLTPKVHCRLLRFQAAVARLHEQTATPLADVALDAGYSDQPHFVREFRELSGITPGEYRRLAPRASHHVPFR
ncbi:MAG TPA: helix-turn-helix domain-containing protein [Myxococcaceae bacterium]|nr:helix-turn-helix domain-containing protein [Myxococcaceae bacterium]